MSYSQMACTKISALDFINKIRTHSLFSFQRSNSFSLRFSAAIRSYHVHFKNARVISFFFSKIISPCLFSFETAVLLSAQIIYHFALLITTCKKYQLKTAN
ncbi:ABC-type uncharacterized transport system substrate-binding protein [Paenibacillus polymyxa]